MPSLVFCHLGTICGIQLFCRWQWLSGHWCWRVSHCRGHSTNWRSKAGGCGDSQRVSRRNHHPGSHWPTYETDNPMLGGLPIMVTNLTIYSIIYIIYYDIICYYIILYIILYQQYPHEVGRKLAQGWKKRLVHLQKMVHCSNCHI